MAAKFRKNAIFCAIDKINRKPIEFWSKKSNVQRVSSKVVCPPLYLISVVACYVLYALRVFAGEWKKPKFCILYTHSHIWLTLLCFNDVFYLIFFEQISRSIQLLVIFRAFDTRSNTHYTHTGGIWAMEKLRSSRDVLDHTYRWISSRKKKTTKQNSSFTERASPLSITAKRLIH